MKKVGDNSNYVTTAREDRELRIKASLIGLAKAEGSNGAELYLILASLNNDKLIPCN